MAEAFYPCISCKLNVRPRQHAITCDVCNRWQHRKCNTGISFKEYQDARKGKTTINFKCAECEEYAEEPDISEDTWDNEENAEEPDINEGPRDNEENAEEPNVVGFLVYNFSLSVCLVLGMFFFFIYWDFRMIIIKKMFNLFYFYSKLLKKIKKIFE